MIFNSAFPGLAGPAARAMLGRGAAGAPPAPVPDFTLDNTSVATTYGNRPVGNFIITNAPPGAYVRLKETTARSSQGTGLAVTKGG